MAAPATAAHERSVVLETTTVYYDPGLMESLRRAAQAAFDADAPSVLGVLVGYRKASGLSITGWMAASSADLTQAIAMARENQPGLEIVGWFRTKHQGEARLTTAELEAGQCAFGNMARPVAVVLRPSGQRPVRVTSYQAGSNSAWAGERPQQEFFLPSPEITLNSSLAPRAEDITSAASTKALPSHGSPEHQNPSYQSRWIAAVFFSATILMALLAIWMPWRAASSQSVANLVTLRMQEAGDQRILHWSTDPTAKGASLTIVHATRHETIRLSPSEYLLANYALPPEFVGKDLEVVLRVESHKASETRLRLVASPTSASETTGSGRQRGGAKNRRQPRRRAMLSAQ